MLAKITRIFFVLITVCLSAYYLPSLYRRCFEERPNKTMLYYSEITQDFIIATEKDDTLSETKSMPYYDRYGDQIDETEAAKLLPFYNVRKLRLMEAMPDSIGDVALTDEVLKNVQRTMLVSESGFVYQINPLFESQPTQVNLSLPDDLFRINRNGIQFIDAETNKIEFEKSELFNNALENAGFTPPSKAIYGIPSNIKRKDDGYFIIDHTGKLFHLIMIKGQPQCRKIETDIDIKLMKCHTTGDVFCHFFDRENNLYVLTRNFEIIKLPINSTMNKTFMIVSNQFYRTYKLTDSDSSTMYVLSPDFKLVDRFAVPVDNYSKSKAAAYEKKFFPFKVMLTPGYRHFIPIPNPPSKWMYTNIIFVVLLLIICIIKRKSIFTPFMIIDILLVGITGVFGFIATMIFPNIQKNKPKIKYIKRK